MLMPARLSEVGNEAVNLLPMELAEGGRSGGIGFVNFQYTPPPSAPQGLYRKSYSPRSSSLGSPEPQEAGRDGARHRLDNQSNVPAPTSLYLEK
ncbi:hypothetical protein PSTG_15868 [Puccinia striiformis f. sp. tritici PST-78]|uniref:Uncharacterized protein n=1 Tax=Puccinia striiformis f. sp. tritici PST-78 TaxID=1165861 RepID=A0A0L0UUU8_9BASI|nr:hypothetical protein PSTG_15868 [Puccinia striiformis f. sp. tritici PST-78]